MARSIILQLRITIKNTNILVVILAKSLSFKVEEIIRPTIINIIIYKNPNEVSLLNIIVNKVSIIKVLKVIILNRVTLNFPIFFKHYDN